METVPVALTQALEMLPFLSPMYPTLSPPLAILSVHRNKAMNNRVTVFKSDQCFELINTGTRGQGVKELAERVGD